MAITLNRLYTGVHQFNAGTVQINLPFVGNTLAVELTTKPEYANTKQRIGTLFQFYGNAQKAYDLFSGRDVVRLELPETDKLWFSPTSYLSDNYSLTIDFTNVGTIVDGSNSVSIPEQILGLPSRVAALEANPVIASIGWNDVTDKPLTFNPSQHNHLLSEVTGLSTELANKANNSHTHIINDVTGLQTALDSKTSTGHTHNLADVSGLQFDIDNLSTSISTKASQSSLTALTGRVTTLENTPAVAASTSSIYIPISTNNTLESNKRYLATANGLTLALPVSPAIGDVVSISTGNFDVKVFHGTANQRILTASFLTRLGASEGVVLRAYADVSFIFLGANLWKTLTTNRLIEIFGTDPFAANVVLFLKGDGTNGSTSIIDSSPSAKTITRFGNTQISTAQSKYGGSSILFDGNGDYLTTPSSVTLQDGNYTIEGCVFVSSISATQMIASTTPAVGSRGIALRIQGGFLGFESGGGSPQFNSSLVVTANQFNHLALSKQGSNYIFAVNGVTQTISNTSAISGHEAMAIGANVRLEFPYYLNGYIDSFRVTQGIARYTANFNPEIDTYLT